MYIIRDSEITSTVRENIRKVIFKAAGVFVDKGLTAYLLYNGLASLY
jgi:hypothetical protein